MGLYARLLLSLVALLLGSMLLLGYVLMQDARQTVDRFQMQQAQVVLEALARGSQDALAARDYEWLQSSLEIAEAIDELAYAYFTRDDGVVIAHSLQERVATQSDVSDSSSRNDGRELSFDGRPVKEIFMPVFIGQQHMADVHLAYFTDTAIGYSEQGRMQLVALVLLTLVLLGAASYLIVRRHVWPVVELSERIAAAKTHHIDLPAHLLDRQDEVGQLSQRFVSLMRHLQNSYQQILREKEFNQVTLASIGDAVIVTDRQGDVQAMNPVSEKLTGWNSAQACGRSVKEVFPIIDASTRQPIANPVEKVLQTGEVVYLSNHTTLLSRQGEEYQIADSAAPIRDEQGEVLGMVLVFNDVTEAYQLREQARRVAEQTENERALLRTLIDAIDDLIYIKDTERRYIACNVAYEKYVGRLEQDIIGKTDEEILAGDLAALSRQSDMMVLDSGENYRSEQWVSYPDGGQVLLDIIKTRYCSPDGELQGVIGFCRDITVLHQQQEQLRQTMKMDALGKLTGGVAHDYNNMLGIIMGYVDMLHNAVAGDAKLEKYTQSIRRASERGAALTRKLLAFSRTDAAAESRVNINRLLSDEQDFLAKTLTARIRLDMNLADELWDVWLDAGDFEDAVLNLCINAMHAMPDKGELRITTCNRQLTSDEARGLGLPDGDYVQLIVCDTGVGMDADVVAHIFDPFFSTKGEQGTGLGLSQVYGFVQRSAGAISVDSRPGEGSCFALLFPRYIGEDVRQQKQIQAADQHSVFGARILVVDDEQDLRELYCEILEQHGYRVLTAASAQEALQCLEQQEIDLLISDVIMSDTDGMELAEQVRQRYPNIKVQLVSGYNTYEADENGLRATMLQKPVQAQQLIDCVANLLAR